VRRAMGPFWGYQEGWLSLSASIFDMAIYPAIFVLYLGKFSPAITRDWREYVWMLAVVVLCCIWNLRGAPAVGEGSVWLSVALLSPFVIFVVLGIWHGVSAHPVVQWSPPASEAALWTAISVALWNYMGWDNASTVAQEVESPQRNYPRAMILSTVVVAVSYVLPLLAMALTGLSVDSFSTGDWMTAAKAIGGPALGVAIVVGGMITGIGMFNALVMSYTRLPMAMAEDGMLPMVFAKRNARGVPWVSVLVCGLAWALALAMPFERLISIDLILYGTSLLLEFVALVVLRIREPNLKRPFKAGNLAFAIALGVGPAALIGYAIWASRGDKLLGHSNSVLGQMPALGFAVIVGLIGPVLYWLTAAPRARRLAAASATD